MSKMSDGKYSEFWCPYCKLWITGLIHRQDYHCDSDTQDEVRSALIRVDGVIYEDEESYEEHLNEQTNRQ